MTDHEAHPTMKDPEIDNEIALVKQLSGVVDKNRITISEIGWTSRTYIVDAGRIVFKFPRDEEYKNEARKEIAVLDLLKKQRFSISIPILNWITEDMSYFGFYGVVGRPLQDVIDDLSEDEKESIGVQLGEFLKQLHSITDHGELSAQTLEEQVEEYQEMYQADRSLLEPFFNDRELKTLDEFFIHEVKECMKGSGELVLCHGDLDYNNTFIDSECHVGVVDFGDAGLYDRSQDFKGIEDRTIREAMMKAYGDEGVISLEAAEATAKMIDILNLPYIIKNRSVEERDECIARIKMRFFDVPMN